jgi:hypothetical protein
MRSQMRQEVFGILPGSALSRGKHGYSEPGNIPRLAQYMETASSNIDEAVLDLLPGFLFGCFHNPLHGLGL